MHNVPRNVKPALGKNPFAISKTVSKPIEIPSKYEDPISTYMIAVDLVRQDDLVGWRQIIKRIRPAVNNFLVEWRRRYEQDPPTDLKSLHEAVDEAIGGISPLLVVALAGVESGREKYIDQRAVFDDIYDIAGWSRSGRDIIVDLPYALGFVYHSLHGAISMSTGQLEVALYMALNIQELAVRIAEDGPEHIIRGEVYLRVPLSFLAEGDSINDRALSLLLRNPDSVEVLWEKYSVRRETMEDVWSNWIGICSKWLLGVFRYPHIPPHAKLFERL